MVWEELRISEEQQEEEKMMVSPWFFTATRFFMIVANKTLKDKQFVIFWLTLKLHRDVRWNWNLTAALWRRSCRLPEPGPAHRGSSGRCAAASDHTAASGWCTGPGRTSPAGRDSQLHDGRLKELQTLKGAGPRAGRGLAGPYLLHGENLFGGSSMLKQTVKFHFWSDLKIQTRNSQSGNNDGINSQTGSRCHSPACCRQRQLCWALCQLTWW